MAICPLFRPFLQPFYAWQIATKTAGRPPNLVQYLAKIIAEVVQTKPTPQYKPPTTSKWIGASDAGANDTTATVGGWIIAQQPTFDDDGNRLPPQTVDDHRKHEALWFHVKSNKTEHPWAFDKTSPQKRIAALELYGTLLLFTALRLQQNCNATQPIHVPMLTDNQGNAFSILNNNTKKWPCAAILMELCYQAHTSACIPDIEHIKRDYNKWADALTNDDFTNFDNNKRLATMKLEDTWCALPTILQLHNQEQASHSKPPPSKTMPDSLPQQPMPPTRGWGLKSLRPC
jgi:hypothetical protein